MISLQFVHPSAFKDRWPLIKEGVEIVAKTHNHWIAEDIYMAIMSGSVNLHIGYKDGIYCGFTITQQQHTNGHEVLHVWAAYSKANDFTVLTDTMTYIKDWAEKINAKRITFSTTRKGWERTAKKLGFKPDLITYGIEL